MRIWALSDLHLSLGGDKPMDIFGDHWTDHHLTMASNWDQLVADEDVVITPGDFSWAMKPQSVAADFAWLAARPGHKVLVKGNHDYWWPSTKTKLKSLLPERTHGLKKTACIIGNVGFFGVRGGDFAPLRRYGDQRSQAQIDQLLDKEEQELLASLAHLETLEQAQGTPCQQRICCFHYPPIPPGGTSSRFTPHIINSGATHCIYGHLHGKELGPAKVEGHIDGIHYLCASCDQINFTPTLISGY